MNTDDEQLTAALDLCRRLPPQSITSNLESLIQLLPEELGDDLLSSVDQPLKVKTDGENGGKDYLVRFFNLYSLSCK